MKNDLNLFPYNGKTVRVISDDGKEYKGEAYVSSDYDMDDMCYIELPDERGDPVIIYENEIDSIEIID